MGGNREQLDAPGTSSLTLYKIFSGSALFVDDFGNFIEPVPLSHRLGVATGLLTCRPCYRKPELRLKFITQPVKYS